jgi:hypothetical protein
MHLRDDRAPVWAIWLLIAFGAAQPLAWALGVGIPDHPLIFVPLLVVWVVLLVLAAIATRRIMVLSQRLSQKEDAHSATLTGSTSCRRRTQCSTSLRGRWTCRWRSRPWRHGSRSWCRAIASAGASVGGWPRVPDLHGPGPTEERRSRPRPDRVQVERTILGGVVRSGEPKIIHDIQGAAPDFLDANVLMSSGFRSALVMPLLSRGRAVGTLNVVSRKPDAFSQLHADALQPIAEILGVAWVAQQLHMTLGKYRTMEVMSELTLAVAAEINSALQTIIGHCDLIERGSTDEALRRDLQTIMGQAQRIVGLLDKMREAAQVRLREMETTMSQEGITSSPREQDLGTA